MTIYQKFFYSNETAQPTKLILEPWAELYIVNPGDQLEVIGSGGKLGSCFELHQTPEGLTVFGWIGSIVVITRDGKVVQPSAQT